MKSFCVLVVLFASGLLFSPNALAQRSQPRFQNPEINVQVRTADGKPAPDGTHIVLEFAQGGNVDECNTRSGGRCQFHPPSVGIYLVKLQQQGYKDAMERVELVNTERGYASLQMIPVPGETPPETPADAKGASVSAADLAVPGNARKEFDAAQKSLDAKDFDSGIAHLLRAIDMYANFPQAYATLGAVYVEQKRFKEAQTALEKAVQLDPKAAGAYMELGAALNQLKDYPGAVTALTKGLELNADVPAANYELAKAYMAQQQWQNAEPPLRKVIAAQPDAAGAHVMLGNVLLKKGDGPGALNEFQTYLKLDPNGPMAAGAREVIPKIQAALAKQQQK
jgi:tetratricopeptide (TPR) repeat protein